MNVKYTIHKTPKFIKDFAQIDNVALGAAANSLTLNGLRVYLYLIKNANDYNPEYSGVDFGVWLGYESYAKDRVIINKTVQNTVGNIWNKGKQDLIKHGYIIEQAGGKYFDFYEFPQPATKSDNSSENKQKSDKTSETDKSDDSSEKIDKSDDSSENEKVDKSDKSSENEQNLTIEQKKVGFNKSWGF